MSKSASTIFCCSAAALVLGPSNQKLHYDPNRELHETIFRSFIGYAIRCHQEAERQEKARIQAQELLQLLMGALNPDVAPPTPEFLNSFSSSQTATSSTRGSFSSTPVSSTSQTPMPATGLATSLAPPHPGLATALIPALQQPSLTPVLTYEALKNNPLSPQTPYVIHLTSRHDFGPVYSHRYFVCPDDLSKDWAEVSLVQWFAQGEPFKMKAEKWDLKCTQDCRFFRMTLRPNLWLRGCYAGPGQTQTQTQTQTRTQAVKQVSYPVAGPSVQTYPAKQVSYPVDNGGFDSGAKGWHVVSQPTQTMQQVLYPVAEVELDDTSKPRINILAADAGDIDWKQRVNLVTIVPGTGDSKQRMDVFAAGPEDDEK
ncbi:hypothetical protein BDZ45DRAFT_100211 [Acephala macrosclerotiorum]|nr:hypothetical protein BDZ45DRAFT_100211 [Acephala macrosclerotiorum]